MHFRKQIRNRIVDILKDANIPRVGANVFSYKLQDTESSRTPSISVYTLDESASKFDEAPRRSERRLNITIEVRDKHPDDDGTLADKVDDLSNFVERAILSDPFLGTWDNHNGEQDWLVDDTVITNTEYQADNTGEEYVMHQSITFSVEYKSDDSIYAQELVDLKSIGYSIETLTDDNVNSNRIEGLVIFDE